MKEMARVSILLFIVIALSFSPAALSELCNPQDKEALLQIKKQLNNPTTLSSSWLPTTDCCKTKWLGVSCDIDTKTYRVNSLDLSDLNLPKPTPIPPSISNLPHLDFLYISRANNLVAPIPSTLTKLTKLRYLYITHTNLSGPIPPFLSQIKTLLTIDFSHNSLSSLPNLLGLSLDGNRISGSIPASYGFFSHQFTVLTLSRNLLRGNVPATLAKLDLAFVDFSQNMLEGDASVLFGANKKRAQKINLAKNLLAFDLGRVRLSESKDLSGLDLRNNRIYGTLPKDLTALKYLKTFNVSYNNLCGVIPKGGKLQRFDESSYAHNKCLCGSPLPGCT